ncbi:rhodanese-like domain-containing protein [Thalassovita mangrovi]|uniref:Rhodanese-like domain-containing protein n=1 Tax=Thalassovita mangrovi TaxID=2692236 RepID=A0A6L8LM66_9RHOB|nr:rhodanese-like domain-containing protein [Thalassovita mangrovi]MYM57104.1 rhodanese-like domain-containing protein [Thalassovita mangrovi]
MRRRFFLVGGIVAVVAAGWAYVSATATPSTVLLKKATGQELAKDDSTLLVDIRRPEEWNQTGVVEGALLVTYTDANSFLKAVRPHLKDGQSLSLICRSGNRTSRASKQVAAAAPDIEVIDIAGGMLRVMGEGYQTVRPR